MCICVCVCGLLVPTECVPKGTGIVAGSVHMHTHKQTHTHRLIHSTCSWEAARLFTAVGGVVESREVTVHMVRPVYWYILHNVHTELHQNIYMV